MGNIYWKKESNLFCCVIDKLKADWKTSSVNDKAQLVS